jgi:branched-chain amino acid transport system substrate-binding protein
MYRHLPLLALLLLAIPAATAQPATAPTIPMAEQAFERGLREYRAGRFQAAHEAFIRAATEFGYNQRTTAGHLMAGKSLYAAGEFEGAASAVTSLIREYPQSRYLDDARRLRRDALARIGDAAPTVAVTDIGVVLPLSPRDAVFTQTLFNGIRLAVDAHNTSQPGRPVRLVFRDSGGGGIQAADAVSELARAGVQVIIGPLYSEEAIAAGNVAERARVALVTPLATDERVSEGRRFVFQANPTFEVRGRMMARYAMDQRLGRLGAVAVRGTLAETMAEAFADEVIRQGQELVFFERLPSAEAWFQLPERLGADRLALVDALYFPVSGADGDEQAAGALRGLDQMLGETATRPRLLGSDEWFDLDASRPRAARYGTVFTADYHIGRASAPHRDFNERYRALAGTEPDRLAFKGYDIAVVVLNALGGQEPVAEALRRAQPYDGLAHRVDFDGGQVNRALHLLRFINGRVERVE